MIHPWQDELQKHAHLESLARKILGVPKGADRMEIKKAFWLLAMKFHPDRNPRDKQAQLRFQNVINAYEFLAKGESQGWLPDTSDTPREEERIGDYLANEWGYLCWWRENYF